MSQKTRKKKARRSASKHTSKKAKKARKAAKRPTAKRGRKKAKRGRKAAKKSAVAHNINVSSLAKAIAKKLPPSAKREFGNALKHAKGKHKKSLKSVGNRLAPKKARKK